MAARNLASLGMDVFAFAAEDLNLHWVKRRLDGFCRELKSRGREAAIFGGGSLRAWLHKLPKPCGIFAANDEMAEKVVSAADSEGIAIPSSLAVLGCDDDARICENAEVTISSIRPDYRGCGRGRLRHAFKYAVFYLQTYSPSRNSGRYYTTVITATQ